MGRARDELRAAWVLLDAELPSQAVARACAAGLQAASAALGRLDQRPGTEAGIVSAFGRSVVGRGDVTHEHGRTLRQLYEHRDGIENALLEAPAAEALRAIAAAEVLVEACSDGGGRGRERVGRARRPTRTARPR